MNSQPLIVDLGMSDTEYLELLAQGRDPVKAFRDKVYEMELVAYGITIDEAQQIAPLLEKKYCSIAEKILVNRALKQIWQRLTKQI
jgi:hypothetical protein